MNEPSNRLEQILARRIPQVPGTLRDDVENTVRKKLKAQTFRDDAKWLGLSFGLLFFVMAGQWILFQNAGSQLRNLSNTSIASTRDGQKVAAAVRAADWQFAARDQDLITIQDAD